MERTLPTFDTPFGVTADQLAKLVNGQEPAPEPKTPPAQGKQTQKGGPIVPNDIVPLDVFKDVTGTKPEDLLIDNEEEEDTVGTKTPENSKTPENKKEPVEDRTKGDNTNWAAFDYIKENELMFIPEDFEFDGSEEKLEELYQKDQEYRQQLAAQEFYNRFKDPALAELFKYAEEAEGFANIPDYLYLQKQTKGYESLDPSDTDQAKQIVTNYLKMKDVDEFTIESTIEKAEIEDKLSTLAESMQKKILDTLEQEKKQMSEAAKKAAIEDRQKQTKFQHEFTTALQKASWDKEKKQKVTNLLYAQEVDGQEYAGYQIAQAQIQNNPEHFLQFLAILSTYDPKEGFTSMKKEPKKTFAEKARNFTNIPKGNQRYTDLEPVLV